MQTTAPRLIDANALEAIMKDVRDCDAAFGSPSEVATWNRAIKELQSAPTVETTDDVEEIALDPEIQALIYKAEFHLKNAEEGMKKLKQKREV